MGFLKKLGYTLGNLLALVAAAGLLARFVSPAIWWPPAVISLGLPLLLLLTALLAAYGLFRRRWRAVLLPVLVTLAALPLLPRLFSVGLGQGNEAFSDTVTVITNNVRSFKNSAAEDTDSASVMEAFRRREPDVLLLQEARHAASTNPYFKKIKSATDLAKRHQLPNRAIATYADELSFVAEHFEDSYANGFMVTDVTTALGPLRIINAHLESNRISRMVENLGTESGREELDRAESMLRRYGKAATSRAQQAERIRRYVRESPYPVIVGGDFNDVPSSYTYQRLLTPRLRDAWVAGGFGIGTTFTGNLPGLRIDFLLVDTALQIRDVELFDNGYSDHLGLRVVVAD